MGLSIQEKKFKIDFQDGKCGGYLCFQSEWFQLFMIYKSPWCFLPSFECIGLSVQEKKHKIDFRDSGNGDHLGFQIRMILASHPDASHQVCWPFSSKKQQTRKLSIRHGYPCPGPSSSTCRHFMTPSPAQGHALGQRYHTLKGLDVGKCHTKFQLSSPESIKVISCKRNAVVNLHLNLQINFNMVTNMTYTHTHVCIYARMDVTSRRNAICPTPAKGRRGHKNRFSRWWPSWLSDWKILATFDLQVTPMLLTKFQVSWSFRSGEEVKNRLSRWRSWRPSQISYRNNFSFFWSTNYPNASYQVFWSTSHPDASYKLKVSSQLAFHFRRRSEK